MRTALIRGGLLAGVFATAAVLGTPVYEAVVHPGIPLQRGDSITVTCPVKTTRDVSNAGRTVKVICPGAPASPTPQPTLTPTVAPSLTPRPTQTLPPVPTVPPFGTRPSSPPIVRSGGSSVLIENVSIDGGTRDSVSGRGITISDVHGSIVIRDVDLADLVGGIYILNSSGTLTIEGVRARNIGDGTIGSGGSNHIQFNNSTFSGVIRDNQFLGGRTEDMISIFQSGGAGPGQELIVERNRLQGLVADTSTTRAWTSGSGTGIIIGDGAGSPKNGWTIVRNNTLLTPGQVGIQHIDGTGITTETNIVYGEKRPLNNNPITSWEGSPRGVIRDNRYCWTNNDGSQPAPWMHQNPSGMVLTNNVRDCSIDPATLRISF